MALIWIRISECKLIWTLRKHAPKKQIRLSCLNERLETRFFLSMYVHLSSTHTLNCLLPQTQKTNKPPTDLQCHFQISSKYWPITRRLLLALTENTQKTIPHYCCVSLLFHFVFHLSPLGHAKEEPPQLTREKKKSLLVFCGSCSSIQFSRLYKYPWM